MVCPTFTRSGPAPSGCLRVQAPRPFSSARSCGFATHGSHSLPEPPRFRCRQIVGVIQEHDLLVALPAACRLPVPSVVSSWRCSHRWSGCRSGFGGEFLRPVVISWSGFEVAGRDEDRRYGISICIWRQRCSVTPMRSATSASCGVRPRIDRRGRAWRLSTCFWRRRRSREAQSIWRRLSRIAPLIRCFA